MRRRLRACRGDGGFTLVEVLAAMTVFMIVAAASTAMFASGLRASLMTKMDTTAKNLSQQRFETMRNLPYHIEQVASGTNPPDLLDTYYVNNSGSVGRGVQGYVPAGAARWTDDGDPASGAFYRYVQAQVPGYTKYKQYVATQFLDDSGNPFTPTGTFNTQVYAQDVAPTGTVGVTVTTLWTAGKFPRVQRAYTQITSGRPAPPTVVLQSRMTALRLSGGLAIGQKATLDLASLNFDGGKSTSVTAATTARAATASIVSGPTVNGATRNGQAPPDSGILSDSGGPQTLPFNGTTYATFGSTSVGGVFAGASTGQPVVAASGNPAKADVLGSGSGARVASFGIDSTAPARLALVPGVQAFVEDAGCGGGCSNVGVTGYGAGTVSGALHGASTTTSATLRGTLALLPTTYAPNGLIRINLTTLTVSCGVSRNGAASPTGTGSVSYSGTLAYFAPTAPGNVGGYVTVALSSAQASSPLTQALLTGTVVATDSLGAPIYLSDYFTGWSSVDAPTAAGSVSVSTGGTKVVTSLGGAIGVTTVPLRDGDQNSVVGAQIGVGSCDAEDYR